MSIAVSLSLGITPLVNNSVVVITDIGGAAAGASPLISTTTFTPCCSTPPNRHGEWYYPNGTQVPNSAAGWDFYRGRGDDGTVRLQRRNNAMSPLGTFYCELPLTSPSDLQRLSVTGELLFIYTRSFLHSKVTGVCKASFMHIYIFLFWIHFLPSIVVEATLD